MEDTASLEVWYKTTFAELKRFRQFWLDNHTEKPDLFPLEMRWADWNEQFHFFEFSPDDD